MQKMMVYITEDKQIFLSEAEAIEHEASLNLYQNQVVGLDNIISFPTNSKIETPVVSVPAVEEKEEEPIHNYSGYGSEGSKYRENRNLSTKEIAALVRKEARAFAKKNGIKVSVRFDSFSGGSSIDMWIQEISFNPFTEEYMECLKAGKKVEWERDWSFNGRPEKFNEKYNAILEELDRILNQYNFDDSDAMTDYFHVNYYGHVNTEWRMLEELEEKVIEGAI